MMTAGTGGFSGSAAAKGPVAGYDPVLKMRGKLKKIKKNVKEETDRVNPKGPSRLFQYRDDKWYKVEDSDGGWEVGHHLHHQFINNDGVVKLEDGTTITGKVNLSKAVKPKVD